MSVVAAWRFREPAGVEPSDERGNIADLVPTAGKSAPGRDVGPLGGAIHFTGNGTMMLEAAPVAGKGAATQVTRDVTLEAVVYIPRAGGEYRIFQKGRGRDFGVVETTLLRLSIGVGSGPAFTPNLTVAWQQESGTDFTLVNNGPPIKLDDWNHVLVVRRWRNSGHAELWVYLNGARLLATTTPYANIGGGADGRVVVGGTYSSTTAVATSANLRIDEIVLYDEAMSAEEADHQYRKLFVLPADGAAMVRALVPPGRAWSRDPGSAIQRELKVEGLGFGRVLSSAELLERDFLPDRAWATLSRWERVTGLSPRPGDTIETRRLRVTTFLRQVHGYSRAEVREALAGILALTADQVAIIENSNRFVDTFAPRSASWYDQPNEGTIAVASGDLTLTAPLGGDYRWSARKAITARLSVPGDEHFEILGQLAAYAVPSSGMGFGLFAYDEATRNAYLFGVTRSGANLRFWRQTVVNGVTTTSTTSVAPPATPFWLSLLRQDRLFTLRYGASADGPWTTATSVSSTVVLPWAGLFLLADTAPSSAEASATWAEVRLWTPKSRLPFEWAVHRDPALAGSPDLVGAQLAVDKLKPGHTVARVVQSVSFKADDPYSLADRDLLGA